MIQVRCIIKFKSCCNKLVSRHAIIDIVNKSDTALPTESDLTMGNCGSSINCTAVDQPVEANPDVAGIGVRHDQVHVVALDLH